MADAIPEFQDLKSLSEEPAIKRCFVEIEQIAGFHLATAQRALFLRYHAYITSAPPPQYITDFRAEGRWYQGHVSGILTDTQNALACVYYHLTRLERIEAGVEAAIAASGAREVLGDALVAGGNTLALDFEYQAFILAVRRCLDYLTRSLAAYFKGDFHSFRRFEKYLATAKPSDVATPLARAQSRHVIDLDFAISESKRRSTRDRISHYEFVRAGVINISKRGFVLAGGGENLLSKPDGKPPPPCVKYFNPMPRVCKLASTIFSRRLSQQLMRMNILDALYLPKLARSKAECVWSELPTLPRICTWEEWETGREARRKLAMQLTGGKILRRPTRKPRKDILLCRLNRGVRGLLAQPIEDAG